MLICATTPDWPPGFSAHLAAKVAVGLADGFVPWHRLHPLPPLYESGVRFRLEPEHGSGIEEFADPWSVAARKWGDCDDLIIYRLTELRAAGIMARPVYEWAGNEIHVLIRHPHGATEDPARILR